MKKKICTVFLLLVLAIQILPIPQMGSLLFSNQFTEEIPHAPIHIDKSCLLKAFLRNDYLSAALITPISGFINASLQHQCFADAIPQNHTGEIHVPPPNC
ncbi:MAG: hypothetical protein V4450_05150 [Bacteroidota bacterium]